MEQRPRRGHRVEEVEGHHPIELAGGEGRVEHVAADQLHVAGGRRRPDRRPLVGAARHPPREGQLGAGEQDLGSAQKGAAAIEADHRLGAARELVEAAPHPAAQLQRRGDPRAAAQLLGDGLEARLPRGQIARELLHQVGQRCAVGTGGGQRRQRVGRVQRCEEPERVRLRQVAQQHRNAIDDRILLAAPAAPQELRARGLHREQFEAAPGVAPAGGADEVYAISPSSFLAAG